MRAFLAHSITILAIIVIPGNAHAQLSRLLGFEQNSTTQAHAMAARPTGHTSDAAVAFDVNQLQFEEVVTEGVPDAVVPTGDMELSAPAMESGGTSSIPDPIPGPPVPPSVVSVQPTEQAMPPESVWPGPDDRRRRHQTWELAACETSVLLRLPC